MGVMACDRKGCTNILCDRLSSEHGYICYECFEELKNNHYTDIEEFMNTEKEEKLHCSEDWNALLKEVFVDTHEGWE